MYGIRLYAMARPLRIEYPGAVYHVTVRGNQRSHIFRSTQDRERFLFKLEESAQRYDIRVYLFCLMTTHIHLVVETPRGNLGDTKGRQRGQALDLEVRDLCRNSHKE